MFVSVFVPEFAAYFVKGILKLQSTPVVVFYLGIVALSPLWIRNVRALEFRKVKSYHAYSFDLKYIDNQYSSL